MPVSWKICVQLVYKKAGLKGLKMDLSNAESTTDSLATGPNIAGGTFTTVSLYGGLAYFAIVRISASVQDSNFSGPLTVHDLLNQSSVYRGGFSPRSVKMYWLSQEVQCFRVDPTNKQNHNAGRLKINS